MPLDLPFPFTLPRLFRSPAISNFFSFPLNLEESLHSYCHLQEPSLAHKICCDKILFSHTQRGYQFLFLDYFMIFRFFKCYFTFLLIFTKIILLLLFYYIFFVMKIVFIFSCSGMFRDVPACPGTFRNVPESSMFRVLSTAAKKDVLQRNLFII